MRWHTGKPLHMWSLKTSLLACLLKCCVAAYCLCLAPPSCTYKYPCCHYTLVYFAGCEERTAVADTRTANLVMHCNWVVAMQSFSRHPLYANSGCTSVWYLGENNTLAAFQAAAERSRTSVLPCSLRTASSKAVLLPFLAAGTLYFGLA